MGKNLVRFVRMGSADGPRWGAIEDQRVFEAHGDPFDEWERGAEVGAQLSVRVSPTPGQPCVMT